MKIVFCASEVVPFAKTGGLADVCGALPLALEKFGHEIVIITPRYKTSKGTPSPVVRIGKNIRVYFVEHNRYFQRDGLYGDYGGDYNDNLERFAFFCHEALATLKDIKFKPDIIHCHDWHTALIPVLLKTKFQSDPFFKNTRSVLTIHNLAYQGVFPKQQYAKLGVEGHLFHMQGLEFYDQINVLKGGIIFSDAITTVSPQYAREIQGEELGCSLDGVLRNRARDVTGILNGLDYEVWNPKDDPFLDFPYSSQDPQEKFLNKMVVRALLNLSSPESRAPLFGFVGRLCHQKGVDLIAGAVDDIVRLGGQIVLTGVGERKYHRILEECVGRHSKNMGIFLKFDESVAHKIYAGCDFFLMPSAFEPCGLGQMIALRYGTIPIVHRTGGLADTIKLYDPIHQSGNGFVFTKYDKPSFVKALGEAVKTYRDQKQMDFLVDQAFRHRFSWDRSAREYQRVYQKCLS
jgi:starch synthase